jgi:hypothetical protein
MIMMGGDKKKMASIIVGADGVADRNEEAYDKMAGEPDGDSLHYAASDIMKAIHGKDVVALKDALHAFFQMADEMPHEEGEHISEE